MRQASVRKESLVEGRKGWQDGMEPTHVAHLPNIMRTEDWDPIDCWLYERGYWPCVRLTPEAVKRRWGLLDDTTEASP